MKSDVYQAENAGHANWRDREIVTRSGDEHFTWSNNLDGSTLSALGQLAGQASTGAALAKAGKVFAGKALLRARALFATDQAFGAWRESQVVGISQQEAWKYMRVAEEYGDRLDDFDALSFAALTALASPSTPKSVKEEVEEKAVNGEHVSAKDIERLKREAADAEKRAQNADAAASRAKSESEALRKQHDILAENLEAAKIKARDEARAAAADELAQLREQQAELEARHAEHIEAIKQAKLDERVAKSNGELSRIERKRLEHERMIDQFLSRSNDLKQAIADSEATLQKMQTFEFEISELDKEANELLRLMGVFAVTLESAHIEQVELPEKLRSTLSRLSDHSLKMSDLLRSHFTPKLRVVDIDG